MFGRISRIGVLSSGCLVLASAGILMAAGTGSPMAADQRSASEALVGVERLSGNDLEAAWAGTNPNGQCVATAKSACATPPATTCTPNGYPTCNGIIVQVTNGPVTSSWCTAGSATQNCTQTSTNCLTYLQYKCEYFPVSITCGTGGLNGTYTSGSATSATGSTCASK